MEGDEGPAEEAGEKDVEGAEQAGLRQIIEIATELLAKQDLEEGGNGMTENGTNMGPARAAALRGG
jgi:hypothetical protein